LTESQILNFTVPAGQKRMRLDQYLTNCIPDISRSKVQRLIKEGWVLIGGSQVKMKHSVRPFEKIEVALPKPAPIEALPEKIPLDIVFEDESLLVINKPAGMVVHPAPGNLTGTLVNALLGYGTSLAGTDDSIRPGIVHRIDKDTSGLLVVAKDEISHRKLALQFEHKTAARVYESIVWPRLKIPAGKIDAPLGRSSRDRKLIAVRRDGKHAITHYNELEKFTFASYIRLKLETGRTHQIRVHMKHLGHPIFGDQVYGGRGSNLAGFNRHNMAIAKEMLQVMQRQALHAKTLGFTHPQSEEALHFESELPQDFDALLQMLRKESSKP